MTPPEIVLNGLIPALFFYGPVILYIIWSWRLLRRYSVDIQAARGQVVPLIIVALGISLLWSYVGYIVAVGASATFYNIGDYQAFADVVKNVAKLPFMLIVGGVFELFPGLDFGVGYTI